METLDTACLFNVGIIARRGDTFEAEFEFTDDQDNPIDITTSTFRINLDININIIAPNILKLSATAAEMAAMGLGDYNYDIEETRNDGTVKTIVNGLFTVKKDYTI